MTKETKKEAAIHKAEHKAEEAKKAAEAKENARLEVASKEQSRIDGIKRVKELEAHKLTIENIKVRQNVLDKLMTQLKEEGITNTGVLEIKQTRLQQDLEAEIKKIV